MRNGGYTKMEFKINEIFGSIQGEGPYTGVPMIFIRFAGCNLNCTFCDTKFELKNVIDDRLLMECVVQAYKSFKTWHVCLTGGEPTLQNISQFVRDLFFKGFKVHLETNGMINNLESKYYTNISFSPKSIHYELKSAHTLKLVYPFINGLTPDRFVNFPCTYRYIQPINYENYNSCQDTNVTDKAIQKLKSYPDYRLSIQIHKCIGVK